MKSLSEIISALESSTESFSAICRRYGVHSGKTHLQIAAVRPDLLGPRSERLGFHSLRKPGSVPNNVRDDAVAAVLAGRLVKDVAPEYGIPAPTLYKYAAAARAKLPKQAPEGSSTQKTADPELTAIRALIDAYAARHGSTPKQVLSSLSDAA